MRVFDVYRGEQVGAGRKSIAFAVAFQSPERTLSDEDAAAICASGSSRRCRSSSAPSCAPERRDLC